MGKKNLDISAIELFTEATAVEMKEEISEKDIELTKRYLFLVKLRIESRRKDFMRKLSTMSSKEDLREDMSELNLCKEDDYFNRHLDWKYCIENEKLLQLLNALPLKQQQILWGIFVQRESQKQLSHQFSVSPVAIHKSMRRAIEQLRRGLH